MIAITTSSSMSVNASRLRKLDMTKPPGGRGNGMDDCVPGSYPRIPRKGKGEIEFILVLLFESPRARPYRPGRFDRAFPRNARAFRHHHVAPAHASSRPDPKAVERGAVSRLG